MALLARLFLIATMLWCCANVAEPAEAHGNGHFEAAGVSHVDGQGADDDCADRGDAAHAGHHHCHVAPDPRTRASDDTPLPGRSLFFADLTARLRSRAQAPPLQPPSA